MLQIVSKSYSAPVAAVHALPSEVVLAELKTSPSGLTQDEAKRRLDEYGPNLLPRGKPDSVLLLLWRQIKSPLILVLIAAGIVAMLVDWSGQGIKNGLVILAVVICNSVIGFVQEYKAGKAIEALSRMVPEYVTALRDGLQVKLPAGDVVPGDVVVLAAGDRVPADARLLHCKSMRVDEAALTGESVPVQKQTDPVAATAALGDRGCMVFGGTLVTYGTAHAIVVGTGVNTELGKISTLLKEVVDLETPMTKALAVIAKYITIAILIAAALMIVIGVTRTMLSTETTLADALRETVIFAIALAVGAIPEGLPAIVTISLAIGVQRMTRRRAVIRKLPAVETLGSTTIICSDKTGTLTRNEMTVQSLWTPYGSYTLSGGGYEPRGELSQDGRPVLTAPAAVLELVEAAALCNDVSLRKEAGQWTLTGDPTEGALVVAAEKLGVAVEPLRREHRRLDAIAFDSDNQFMATLHQFTEGTVIILKGAPEVVLPRCVDVDAEHVLQQVELLAAEGMRVLAVAVKPVADQQQLDLEHVQSGLRLLGIVGMIDPPRQEAIQAIKLCHHAGITVKMITGDHPSTSVAIAAELGILTSAGAISGPQLAALDDAQFRETARRVNVFARMAPEQKLRLVKALQSDNEIVAMTGDGVNDAPALKQANIGVAMGIAGTAVSKQAADIVLTDDNFASIAAAVEEGRKVYDNLIKSLVFVLPTNLGLALILLCAVAFFPFSVTTGELLLAMSPVQLLWINLVATVSLALPLAFEAAEPDIMRRPPRRPGTPVLSPFVLLRTAIVALLMTAGGVGLFLFAYHSRLTDASTAAAALAEAQTLAVTTIILFQCFYLLNCRSLHNSLLAMGLLSNPTIFIGIGVLLLLQAAYIYLPFFHRVFGSAPLSAQEWLISAAVGAVILPVIMIEKRLHRRGVAADSALGNH